MRMIINNTWTRQQGFDRNVLEEISACHCSCSTMAGGTPHRGRGFESSPGSWLYVIFYPIGMTYKISVRTIRQVHFFFEREMFAQPLKWVDAWKIFNRISKNFFAARWPIWCVEIAAPLSYLVFVKSLHYLISAISIVVDWPVRGVYLWLIVVKKNVPV